MSAINPVFIVGAFRSGTSLLCSLLNHHSSVALMFESDVWNFPRPLLGWRFQRHWTRRIEFYNEALSRHRLVTAGDFRLLKDVLTPDDLYRAYGRTKGASVYGEKSPFYCERLLQLHQQYPQAGFILIWRDPVEVYRSVVKAGQTSRFFARPGMLSRILYLQDQLIKQGKRLEKLGARVYHVDYAGLVDHTEEVCREICGFVGVPFEPGMLQLNRADLSAIYKAPNHAHLRRGIVERQKYTEELLSPAVVRKLQRYRYYWERQQSEWLKPSASAPSPAAGPGLFEYFWHNMFGRFLMTYDSLMRAGFEFVPINWHRVYRLLRNWVVNPPNPDLDTKVSLTQDLREHWGTILIAGLLTGGVAFIHHHSNPHLFFILFYGVPCALLALVVNTRWATLFAVACSIISPLIQSDGDSDYNSAFVFLWNSISRLILLEILVLMLGRIRQEFDGPNPLPSDSSQSVAEIPRRET